MSLKRPKIWNERQQFNLPSIDRSKDMASFGAAVKISWKGIGGQSSQSNPRDGNGKAL
jgi:hypothetical protein